MHLGSWRRVPEKRTARSPIASWPRRSPNTEAAGLHPRRVPAGDGAPVLRLVGLPDDRLLRAHQPLRHAAGLHVPDRPPAPGGHRRDPRLGAVALSRRTSTAWPTSTARTSTSTPTRARASTPTGTATSSITAATRCAASCSRSALFWLDQYHIDGLRVDAVASMLYLDYSRKARRVDSQRATAAARTSTPSRSCGSSTKTVYRDYPGVQTDRRGVDGLADGVAARRTSAASASASSGTWAGCTTRCDYFELDPVSPQVSPRRADVPQLYAFNENFVLPLSHDEVVHGKGSLLDKMPGDDWQKFANLRLLFGYMCRSRARSCSSWAARSASGASGTTSRASTGTWSPMRGTAESSAGRGSQSVVRREPALYELDSNRRDSTGLTLRLRS